MSIIPLPLAKSSIIRSTSSAQLVVDRASGKNLCITYGVGRIHCEFYPNYRKLCLIRGMLDRGSRLSDRHLHHSQ
ncbi:MAG: hypothetical protein V7L01_32530 [Nostoc sp.]|uniref:hypothetical protein n=1 Tax=Nostoc sp. TaxID=1180 RepID=UPI002FFA11AC